MNVMALVEASGGTITTVTLPHNRRTAIFCHWPIGLDIHVDVTDIEKFNARSDKELDRLIGDKILAEMQRTRSLIGNDHPMLQHNESLIH